MREVWWGTQKDYLTRQETRARPEAPPRRVPAKKDTRRWCRGKRGREHVLVIVRPVNAYPRPCGWHTQRYLNGWDPRTYYQCQHAEVCRFCGKVFRRHYGWMSDKDGLRAEECPDYTPRA